jgi:murein DD-endopeptidase MepM/ murein hydrolase activator NlpD
MKATLSLVLAGLLLAGCTARTGAPAPVEYGGGSTTPPRAQAMSSSFATVAKGDTVYSVAKRHNVLLPALLSANSLSPPYRLTVGQRLTLPASGQYVVERSDTLYGIARMHGLTPQVIIAANNIKPPYELKTGQRLTIPGGGLSVVATAPASSRGTGAGVSSAPVVSSNSVSSAPAPAPSASPKSGVEVASLPPPVTKESLPPPVSKESLPPPASTSDKPTAPVLASPPPLAKSLPPSNEPSIEPPSAPPPAIKTASTSSASPLPKPPPRSSKEFAWPVKGKVVTAYGKSSKGVQNDGINIAAAKGATVSAAENGVVAYVGADLRGFGNLVLIKHADGWVTAYAHNEELMVKRGDKVRRGQPIAKVGSSGHVDTPQLHFEIRKDSRPVDPTKVLGG